MERAKIIGAYATDVGRHPGKNSLQLHAMAAQGALADAGLDPRDVDGVVTLGSFSSHYLMQSIALAEYLGLTNVVYADVVRVGGASAVAAVLRTSLLVAAGACRNALIVSGDDQLSGMTRDLAIRAMFENRHPQYEAPYGPTTAAAYAIAARRYLHDHGLDESMLAYATIQSRQFASRRTGAMMTKPVTVDDVVGSRPIADPLRLLHCAPIADGAAAVILSNTARRRRGVIVRGGGERHTAAHLVYNDDLVRTPATDAAAIAYRDSRTGSDTIDVALVYDAFASSVGSTLEDLALAPRGKVFHGFRDGEFGPDGRLPVNPHGGLLSGGHPGYPGGLFHVVEAVRQLRGDAQVQLRDPRVALVHGSGGIMTSQAVAVLEAPE